MKTKIGMLTVFILIFSLAGILSMLTLVSAETSGNSCSLTVSLLSQDPYPAVPGGYVNVVFQISGTENANCNGAKFKLVPSYPFSLDDNNTDWKILSGSTYTPYYQNYWNIPYKLRIDKGALDGNATLEVYYNSLSSPNANPETSYASQKFDITIKDSRTAFDAVIQDSSSSEVSIAIANIGKYAANSMIVRIPQQENFRVSGTNGQMVGNLESGDYTIVGFTIIQNMQRTQGATGTNSMDQNNLTVQVDYTDGIGERRTSILEIPFAGTSFSTNSTTTTGTFPNGFGARRQTTSVFSQWYFWVIIVLVLLLGFGFYNKYKTRIKNHFAKIKDKSKSSNKEKDSETPDWVKKEKAKK
jgi:hypothetical protein